MTYLRLLKAINFMRDIVTIGNELASSAKAMKDQFKNFLMAVLSNKEDVSREIHQNNLKSPNDLRLSKALSDWDKAIGGEMNTIIEDIDAENGADRMKRMLLSILDKYGEESIDPIDRMKVDSAIASYEAMKKGGLSDERVESISKAYRRLYAMGRFDNIESVVHYALDLVRSNYYIYPYQMPARASDGGWLWEKFMDFCKKRGVSPTAYNDLFLIVGEFRKKNNIDRQNVLMDEEIRIRAEKANLIGLTNKESYIEGMRDIRDIFGIGSISNQWIGVDIRLPEDERKVIASSNNNGIVIARYMGEHLGWTTSLSDEDLKKPFSKQLAIINETRDTSITSWMEIPKKNKR